MLHATRISICLLVAAMASGDVAFGQKTRPNAQKKRQSGTTPRGRQTPPPRIPAGPRGTTQPKVGKSPGGAGQFTRPPIRIPQGKPTVQQQIGRRRPTAGRSKTVGPQVSRQRVVNLQQQLRYRPQRGSVAAPRYRDWQFWYHDYYRPHSWYQGTWHGAWYDRYDVAWRRAWGRYPVVISLGVSPWGRLRSGYWFGYWDYSNPYYVQPYVIGETTIDLSQPFAAPPTQADGAAEKGMVEFDRARREFLAQNYAEALAHANAALQFMPNDAPLHEFRALTLFALGNYRPAAETLNALLAVGPGWDWKTMIGNYSGVAGYTRQLRELENATKAKPKIAYLHFLLGYHYLVMGHTDAAAKQFQETVALQPKDTVAARLLDMIGEPKVETPPEPGMSAAVPAGILNGEWNAKRGNESFQLVLTQANRFEWTHTNGKQQTVIKGVYALDGDTLAMEPEAGGVMLGTIHMRGKDGFQFKMIGAGEKDAGLSFSK